MATREQIEAALDGLPESELEPVLEFIASRAANGADPEAARPGDVVDDWGNLSAIRRASSARKLARLDAEDAAAGFSWDQYL